MSVIFHSDMSDLSGFLYHPSCGFSEPPVAKTGRGIGGGPAIVCATPPSSLGGSMRWGTPGTPGVQFSQLSVRAHIGQHRDPVTGTSVRSILQILNMATACALSTAFNGLNVLTNADEGITVTMARGLIFPGLYSASSSPGVFPLDGTVCAVQVSLEVLSASSVAYAVAINNSVVLSDTITDIVDQPTYNVVSINVSNTDNGSLDAKMTAVLAEVEIDDVAAIVDYPLKTGIPKAEWGVCDEIYIEGSAMFGGHGHLTLDATFAVVDFLDGQPHVHDEPNVRKTYGPVKATQDITSQGVGNVVSQSAELGTGPIPGKQVEVGRNESGDGAAGCLVFTQRDGTKLYVWGHDDKLRIHTAPPTEDDSVDHEDGVVVGTQT